MSERKSLVVAVRLGRGGGLFPHHPPLLDDWSHSSAIVGAGAGVGVRVGVGAGCVAGFDLIDKSFYGGELIGQIAQTSLEGVELFEEVV